MAPHHTESLTGRTSGWRQPAWAIVTGTGVGMLGGLLGLGGAEFRLPVLVRLFGYGLPRAIRFNLVISGVTVLAALTTRVILTGSTSAHLTSLGAPVLGMIPGGMAGAYLAGTWLITVSEAALHRMVRTLLLGIGVLLIVEAGVPWASAGLPLGPLGLAALGCVAGLGIGVVSSVLGVAGGELIIPTLIFGFGAEVKLAGTLSLLISLPTILVGLRRHWVQGHRFDGGDLATMILPMAAGSIAGAVLGGALVRYAPAPAVKMLLGLVLIGSALKAFSPSRVAS